jgi:hypothetical protein
MPDLTDVIVNTIRGLLRYKRKKLLVRAFVIINCYVKNLRLLVTQT